MVIKTWIVSYAVYIDKMNGQALRVFSEGPFYNKDRAHERADYLVENVDTRDVLVSSLEVDCEHPALVKFI